MTTALHVGDLVVAYRGRSGGYTQVLGGVTFSIDPGEVMSIVGESGAGKTTLVNAVLGLVPTQRGTVTVNGSNVLNATPKELRSVRRNMQVVFQNPYASLDPRLRIADSVAEPLRTHTRSTRSELRRRVLAALDEVGLEAEHADRYPHQLSGGQAQRVAIARALILRPTLLILDEPTAALDVSVQAQLLNLLLELRDRQDLTYLLVSHDLSIVRHMSDTVAVMRKGEFVEQGAVGQVLSEPAHLYTRTLLQATPVLRLV